MAGIEQYEWYKELIATPHGRALVNDLQATCAARMNVSQQEATEGERLPTIREKYYPDSNALRTFAHHDEILVGIADRHKENFDEAQVIDVAINCLDGGDWLTLDNPKIGRAHV